MSKSHDYAWAAGFFDGEGYVTIQRRNMTVQLVSGPKTYTGHYLRLGINHVRVDPLYEMQRIFGGNIRLSKNTTGKRKPRYTWGFSCVKAKDCLEQMRPYLKNKKEVADLGIHLQNKITAAGKVKVTEKEYAVRESIKDEIVRLNAKG